MQDGDAFVIQHTPVPQQTGMTPTAARGPKTDDPSSPQGTGMTPNLQAARGDGSGTGMTTIRPLKVAKFGCNVGATRGRHHMMGKFGCELGVTPLHQNQERTVQNGAQHQSAVSSAHDTVVKQHCTDERKIADKLDEQAHERWTWEQTWRTCHSTSAHK